MKKIWEGVLTLLRFNGKESCTFFTFNVVGMCWYCIVHKQPIDGAIATMYLGLVTAYTANRTITDKRTPSEQQETKNGKD